MSARKSEATVLCILLLANAHAQTPSRNEFVIQIEEAIGKPPPVTDKSPLVTTTLTAAKSANPEVDSKTWDEVRADTAVVLTRMSSGPGSSFDNRIRGALDSFTDAELQSLDRKLNDPLLLKFRDALQSQPNDYQTHALSNALQMATEINSILEKHNLKQISLQ